MNKLNKDATLTLNLNERHHSKTLIQSIPIQIMTSLNQVSITVDTADNIWLTGMLYDEAGELRMQFMNLSTPQPIILDLDETKTSPYTTAGLINPGVWRLDLIAQTDKLIWTDSSWGQIKFSSIPINCEPESDRLKLTDDSKCYEEVIKDEQARWYKGDFHTHTIYSDGKMTQEENSLSAKHQDLDFFFATDHQLVPKTWNVESDVLVIPGVEVTAPLGHYNLLGSTRSPFETHLMTEMLYEAGMNKIIHGTYDDALISINHPFLSPWEWLFKETPLESIDCIEIWNDPTYADNKVATEKALKAWDILLNDGYRITGIGGSDSHMRPDEKYENANEPSLIGDPGTYVYCDYLSKEQIINQVRKGHVTVSRGSRIDFRLGNNLPGDYTEDIGDLSVQIATDESLSIEWVVNGQVSQVDHGNQANYLLTQDDRVDVKWIRVNVRYKNGELYGFTNPIYFKKVKSKLVLWDDLLTKMSEVIK